MSMNVIGQAEERCNQAGSSCQDPEWEWTNLLLPERTEWAAAIRCVRTRDGGRDGVGQWVREEWRGVEARGEAVAVRRYPGESVGDAGSRKEKDKDFQGQEEIDSTSSRLSPTFSSHLHEAEQRIRRQRMLDELQLEMELLKMEKESADVTHRFYLTRRFQTLQMFCGHLQDLLKDQNSLRQRLMKPLGRFNLPVQAHLHRFVVDVVKMLLDFIETLEEKLISVRCSPTTRDRLTQLLLAHVAEVESLSNQVLRWKEVRSSSMLSDSST
ncbi:HAUS augmin-like complex subunit 2 [Collichthys lucidus]|uniref:HAUS augmin-like complex subunit 2 n=1 Tax=Collichthys lucidus TaxID=240159 RepID=A0A4V6ARY3_COLLU|nr:HAUS augmin-like complex subunit 2 [Collichthys lucidus]